MPFIEEIEQEPNSLNKEYIQLFNTFEGLEGEVDKLLNKGISPSSFKELMILKNCYHSALTAIVKLSPTGGQ